METLSIFHGEEWDRLIANATVREYRPGQIIFLQNEPYDYLVVVTDGVVKNVMYLPNGKEKTFHFLKAPTLIGECGMFDDQGNISTAVAVTPVTGALIPSAEMKAFLLANPEALYTVSVRLVRKTRSVQAQAEDVFAPVPKKLARLLLDEYRYGVYNHEQEDHAITLKHTEIASILGTTRQRVTQYLTEFENRGFIERVDGRLLVKNDRKLMDFYNEND